jgi:hypothetical protein
MVHAIGHSARNPKRVCRVRRCNMSSYLCERSPFCASNSRKPRTSWPREIVPKPPPRIGLTSPILERRATYATLRLMPDRSRKPRPRDPNQLAKLIVDIATGQVEDTPDTRPEDAGKDPAAVSLGRRGGLKGGHARAQRLTPQQRSEAARKAVQARWSKSRDNS